MNCKSRIILIIFRLLNNEVVIKKNLEDTYQSSAKNYTNIYFIY